MGTPEAWIICKRCKEPLKADAATPTICLEEYNGEPDYDRSFHVVYVHELCMHDAEDREAGELRIIELAGGMNFVDRQHASAQPSLNEGEK